MARLIKLFRYFGKNYPIITDNPNPDQTLQTYLTSTNITTDNNNTVENLLISGHFMEDYTPIILLGIQTLPGTRFFLNQNINEIIIGSSGIYELDLTDSSGEIDKILFDKESIDNISNNPNGYLIIDIVYEGG